MSTRHPRYSLPKADLLLYALEGAKTRRGVSTLSDDEEYRFLLDRDIAEIKRRIKLVCIAESRRKNEEQVNDG